MTYSFVIPAYNEAAAIAEAVRRTATYAATLGDFEIVVVDDGSNDDTARVVEDAARADAHVRLVRLPENRGKGAAVRAGMAAVTGDWRIFLDADLSTAPEAFETFRSHLAGNDVIIGSRAVSGAIISTHQPSWREAGGKFYNHCVRMITRLPFHDTQCGFKAFNVRATALFTDVRTDGWAFDVEVLSRCQKAGLRIKELPVIWRHDRSSTVRVGGMIRAVADLVRIRLQS